jgi:hypothetical protein
MDQNSDVAVAPNQSFVKLSFKQRPKEGDLNPEILFWWLNSDVCKKALESRALSQGVPRLSIMDVAELKIPVGSKQMLMLEYQKYITWKSDAMKSLEYQNRAHALRSMAFN